MSDLTLKSYAYCSELEDFSLKASENKYTVKYGRSVPGLYQYNWHCTCPSFKYRRRCKHIEHAKKVMCDYDEFLSGERPVDGKCPKCGKEVLTRLVGV